MTLVRVNLCPECASKIRLRREELLAGGESDRDVASRRAIAEWDPRCPKCTPIALPGAKKGRTS